MKPSTATIAVALSILLQTPSASISGEKYTWQDYGQAARLAVQKHDFEHAILGYKAAVVLATKEDPDSDAPLNLQLCLAETYRLAGKKNESHALLQSLAQPILSRGHGDPLMAARFWRRSEGLYKDIGNLQATADCNTRAMAILAKYLDHQSKEYINDWFIHIYAILLANRFEEATQELVEMLKENPEITKVPKLQKELADIRLRIESELPRIASEGHIQEAATMLHLLGQIEAPGELARSAWSRVSQAWTEKKYVSLPMNYVEDLQASLCPTIKDDEKLTKEKFRDSSKLTVAFLLRNEDRQAYEQSRNTDVLAASLLKDADLNVKADIWDAYQTNINSAFANNSKPSIIYFLFSRMLTMFPRIAQRDRSGNWSDDYILAQTDIARNCLRLKLLSAAIAILDKVDALIRPESEQGATISARLRSRVAAVYFTDGNKKEASRQFAIANQTLSKAHNNEHYEASVALLKMIGHDMHLSPAALANIGKAANKDAEDLKNDGVKR